MTLGRCCIILYFMEIWFIYFSGSYKKKSDDPRMSICVCSTWMYFVRI